MRLLVTGGRDFKQHNKIIDELNKLEGVTLLIEGGCKGVDEICRTWAQRKGIPTMTFFPQWDTYGKAAGPIRNEWMLKFGQPTFALVFPGGEGTKNCLKLIIKYGVEHMIVV